MSGDKGIPGPAGPDTLEDARRGKQAAEEMLGFVLLAVGGPVVVKKELIKNGIPSGATIKIDESLEDESFIFSVEVDDA